MNPPNIPLQTVLTSKHYRLRLPTESDRDFVFSATRYPNFNEGMAWNAPKTKAEIHPPSKPIAQWKAGQEYTFTIETKSEHPQLLGKTSIRKTNVALVWNVGYWIHPEQQGKGIMTEVLGCLVAFGFNTLKAKSITACYAIWNKASEKVLLNNGFKFVRHLEQGFQKNGQWVAENEFGLTRANWEKASSTPLSNDFHLGLVNNKNTIFENEHFVVVLDIDPISLGHVLICPKQPYQEFHEMPDVLVAEMMLLAKRYIRILQQLFSPKGYSMMLNAGEFNDLKHCHLHIFPRNSITEFQWTYDESILSKDATRFEVLKQLIKGHF